MSTCLPRHGWAEPDSRVTLIAPVEDRHARVDETVRVVFVGTRQNGKRFPGLLEDDGPSGARLFHLILFRRLEVALTTGAFYPAPR